MIKKLSMLLLLTATPLLALPQETFSLAENISAKKIGTCKNGHKKKCKDVKLTSPLFGQFFLAGVESTFVNNQNTPVPFSSGSTTGGIILNSDGYTIEITGAKEDQLYNITVNLFASATERPRLAISFEIPHLPFPIRSIIELLPVTFPINEISPGIFTFSYSAQIEDTLPPGTKISLVNITLGVPITLIGSVASASCSLTINEVPKSASYRR